MFYVRNVVGRQVRKARLSHNPKMTQAELAAKLQLADWNIDRAGIAKIESGIREVTDMEVLSLATVLNVTAAWLFGEEK